MCYQNKYLIRVITHTNQIIKFYWCFDITNKFMPALNYIEGPEKH